MKEKSNFYFNIFKYTAFAVFFVFLFNGSIKSNYLKKIPYFTIASPPVDSSQYFKKENPGSFVQTETNGGYILPSPKNVVQNISYDAKTNTYKITETVNGVNVKPPMTMTFDEYADFISKKENAHYFESRNNATNIVGSGKVTNNIIPPINIKNNLAEGIFGPGGVDIKPQGNLTVLMGYNYNIIKNPALSPLQQSQGIMNFDMNINLSVTGKIGDKFQQTLKYNNQAGFGFDGQKVKLAYNGKEDEILRNLEAGDISFDVPTQLISSAQSLFGVKTELQFGKVNIKAALSQQRSNRQTKIIENGAETQKFELTSDQYDQNRHFFLSQYFRNQFETALKNLPLINSQIQVTNVEVWVSNRSVATQSIRDVIAFQDIGESQPFSPFIHSNGSIYPDNDANDLYGRIKTNESVRNVATSSNTIQGGAFNLVAFKDFERAYCRKLSSTEYTLNPQLGYISLNTSLQPNDVLAVAFQYTVNGKLYQVGDLSRDLVSPDSASGAATRLLYLKTLKGTNMNPTYPMWDLMMKNVYSLGAYQVSNNNFRLDIFYNDPGGGQKRYLPKGNLQNESLIRVMNLDRLNINNEPYPDGIFDFVPNITIQPTNGKIIFPVLEPFGSHLKQKLIDAGNSDLVNTYTYQQLYDSTQFIALNYPEFNRFVIKGNYQSANNKRINIGFGVPRGGIKVTMNGQILTEGSDYIAEYGAGYIEIQDHILASGGKIQIDYENNATFGLQTKNFTGLRTEYRANSNFKIGATYENLSERPFNNKINFGEDPINNTIIGGDIKLNESAPFITRLLDKLPFYSTNESSNISLYGEVAHLIPGHYSSIGSDGTIYLDDFDGTIVNYNLGATSNVWKLASTPKGATNANGTPLFPEASLSSLENGFNRAKLSWYNISSAMRYSSSATPSYLLDDAIAKNLYMRSYNINDVYVGRYQSGPTSLLTTFDIAFFPEERGPYNYEYSNSPTPGISSGISQNGRLKDPTTRWAGIQRAIDNTNFETSNIEYVQFWLLDPFIKNKSNKGDLYFNLGYVSEDVLKDSRMAYEQGLQDKTGSNAYQMDTTRFGYVPKISPLIQAFDNNPSTRPVQDIGYDGLSNAEEKEFRKVFLQNVKNSLTTSAYSVLENDPSSDNFVFYLDPALTAAKTDIIGLYKNFNNVENNSPVNSSGSIPQSNYSTPDNEDINKDNTLNENESYYQYRIPMFPGMNETNNKYITSRIVSPNVLDGRDSAVWLQFRIPIKEYTEKVGQISDFRNIQFARMFLTNFSDSVVMRFVDLNFVRNQWRKYTGNIQDPTDYNPIDNSEDAYFNIGAVGLEENSNKTPVNYVVPNNIVREVGVNATSNPIQLNEQALRMSFCGIKDGQAKACFKNIDFDFRQFKNLKLLFHAESNPSAISPVKDKELSAFIRIGSDFKENYYEYEIPLKITPERQYSNTSSTDKEIVWPDSNIMNITLAELVQAKMNRNAARFPTNTPYIENTPKRNITVVGNPDIGLVKVAMIGIRNRAANDKNNFITNDDGMPKCGEVWANEMTLNGLNEQGGTAAIANVDVKLADLGNLKLSGSMYTIGFGQIEQRVNERKKDDFYQYNVSSTLQLGKLFPKKWGLQLPFFAQFGKSVSTPQFDPFTLDINSKTQSEIIKNTYSSDSANQYLESIQTIETRSGFNFTGVRIVPTNVTAKVYPWSIRNLSASYSFNSIKKSSPFIKADWMRTYMGELNYSYGAQPIYIEPFRKIIKSNNKWFDWIKSLHINFVPTTMSVSNRIDRQFGIFNQRQLPGESSTIPVQYLKSFTWNRNYALGYNPFRTFSINYTATNLARIDEPQGGLESQKEVDSIWSNIKKFGRTTQFNQNISGKLSIPLSKLPLFSFVTTSLDYLASYNWTTGPQILGSRGELIQSPQGNTVTNAQKYGVTASFNMTDFYKKIPFIKNVDKPAPPKNAVDQIKSERDKIEEELEKEKDKLKELKKEKKEIKKTDTFTGENKKIALKNKKAEIKLQRKKIKDVKSRLSNAPDVINPILKAVVQPLLMIKKMDAGYNIDNNTTINGFTQTTQYFGIDYSKPTHLSESFVLGMQPGIPLLAPPDKYGRSEWLNNAASNGWITKDTSFNLPFLQSNTRVFNARMSLVPYKGIDINLNWKSSYSQKYSEIFKYDALTGKFVHYNPMESGSYSYSDINIFSSSNKIQSNGSSENIRTLTSNTEVYAARFQDNNPYRYNSPYIDPMDQSINAKYFYGYGPLQQDVLVNSFLTTYHGGNAKTSDVSPFSRIPLPNWDITVNGLKDLDFMKKIFNNFSLKNSYTSETTISSYNSDLRYFGGGSITNPNRIDSLSNNFIPYYYIPNVAISESFMPLSIDFTTKNNLNGRMSFKNQRNISLSLIDYLLTENEMFTITAGGGVKLKNVRLPLYADGKPIVLHNDLVISFDFSYSDQTIVNHRLGQKIDVVTGGSIRYTISPKIDYVVNDKFNLSIFYNHNFTSPKVSNSFPITNIAAGIKLNFSLTP